MNKFLNLIKLLLGWPLTLIAFYFIGKVILTHTSEIVHSFRNFDIFFLLLGITFFVSYFFLRTYFWKKLLEYYGYNRLYREITFSWGVSELRRYIPGNIWSLVSRTNTFAKKDIPKTVLVKSLIIEMVYLILSCFLLSVLSINFIIYGIFINLPYKGWIVNGTTFVVLMIISLVIWNRYLFKFIKLKRILIFSKEVRILPAFSPLINLSLLGIMSTAFFCFGLGTYFSIASFVYLYPSDFLTFIGLFIFSFLVGYVSFITPMGLGIRESIMTLGLAKFISSVSIAAAAAITSRFLLIISELLFIFIAFLWYKMKNRTVAHYESWITSYYHEIILGLSIFAYTIYFTGISFLRYTNFYTGRFDLGNHDQTVWNTLHGRLFQLTDPNGTDTISRLAFHADFILILLAPFYYIWQDPRMLLLIQTIVLALGAIFVFLIGKHTIGNKILALIFALCYLLYPSVEYTNIYDFHGVTLATTFLLASFYFLKTKRYIWYIVFLMLAGLTKEEVWIITALMGLYTLFTTNRKLLGISIFSISSALFFYLVFIAIPHARGGAHFALSYYSDFGSTPKEIVKNILFSPAKTLSVFFQQSQLLYLLEILLPFSFLPLIGLPFLIFIAPELIADLLSSNSHPHEIYYQYTASLTPFLIIAAIYGTKKLHEKFPRISYHFIAYSLCFTTVISTHFFGPSPLSINPNIDMIIKSQPNSDDINSFISNIPRRFSVAATNNLGSHLSHRQKIFTIPVGIDKADIILFLLNDPYAQPSLQAQKDLVQNMKHNKSYIEIFKLGDFVVFEKRNLYAHTEPNTSRVKLFPLSIPALQGRDYVGGDIQYEKTLSQNKKFTSYLISYPSDGLKIYALMNVPTILSLKKFPTVIINTGYNQSPDLTIQTTYERITDYFASQGFLVIKPEHRGSGNTETDGTLPVTPSYPIDILNLLSSIGTIQNVDINNVFLWGHSLGGTVTLTTLEAHDQNRNYQTPIRAASVWAPITDPYLGYSRLHELFPSQIVPYANVIKQYGDFHKNPILWQSISPLFYADDIRTPIEIIQSADDTIVPYQWSIELYDDLSSYNLKTKLLFYPDDDHRFSKYWNIALNENIQFFRKYMKR